jgi:hypothetical protein
MTSADGISRPPDSALLAAAVDHVRLSYHYRRTGDIDGYGSLLAVDAVLQRPGRQEIRGRERIEAYQALCDRDVAEHVVYDVFGSGNRLVAEGRLDFEGGRGSVDFTETFWLTEHGLLRAQKIYFFTQPT